MAIGLLLVGIACKQGQQIGTKLGTLEGERDKLPIELLLFGRPQRLRYSTQGVQQP